MYAVPNFLLVVPFVNDVVFYLYDVENVSSFQLRSVSEKFKK